jgi:hypothetical protein
MVGVPEGGADEVGTRDTDGDEEGFADKDGLGVGGSVGVLVGIAEG